MKIRKIFSEALFFMHILMNRVSDDMSNIETFIKFCYFHHRFKINVHSSHSLCNNYSHSLIDIINFIQWIKTATQQSTWCGLITHISISSYIIFTNLNTKETVVIASVDVVIVFAVFNFRSNRERENEKCKSAFLNMW